MVSSSLSLLEEELVVWIWGSGGAIMKEKRQLSGDGDGYDRDSWYRDRHGRDGSQPMSHTLN
eukprot:15345224-Ditylum_brightwellii.AAC.1